MGGREPRLPAAEPDDEPAPRRPRPPRETARTAVVPRSEAPTEVAQRVAQRQARRDRAVTREDARQLTFDDPGDEPPLAPDDVPSARDGR